VNIGFRVQRAGFEKTDGESAIVEGEIRRMRLKLTGLFIIKIWNQGGARFSSKKILEL
jgi:hypothetical protein